MWHGASARFHEGAVAILRGVPDPELADQSCAVLRYDASAGRWVVRLVHPRYRGREVTVPEEHLSFNYCVLPENAFPSQGEEGDRGGDLQEEERQGTCGRGLSAARAYEPGETLFSEEPFMLAEAHGDTMWLARWLAYLKLFQASQASSKESPTSRALGAFQQLHGSTADAERRRRTEEAAEAVCRQCFKGEKASIMEDNDLWKAHVANVASVLARWQANQFHYQSGRKLGASAVFRRISRINHSCSPTVGMELHWGPLAPGALKRGDGRAVVKCRRALQPGDPLCFNYGPKDLVEWPLARRRKYLLERHGFLCGCPRCLTEGAAPEAPLPEAAAAAAAPSAGGCREQPRKGVACRCAVPLQVEYRCSRHARRRAFPRGGRRRG